MDEGFNSISVVFMHSYAFPEHEKLVQEEAKKVGFE